MQMQQRRPHLEGGGQRRIAAAAGDYVNVPSSNNGRKSVNLRALLSPEAATRDYSPEGKQTEQPRTSALLESLHPRNQEPKYSSPHSEASIAPNRGFSQRSLITTATSPSRGYGFEGKRNQQADRQPRSALLEFHQRNQQQQRYGSPRTGSVAPTVSPAALMGGELLRQKSGGQNFHQYVQSGQGGETKKVPDGCCADTARRIEDARGQIRERLLLLSNAGKDSKVNWPMNWTEEMKEVQNRMLKEIENTSSRYGRLVVWNRLRDGSVAASINAKFLRKLFDQFDRSNSG